MSGLRITVECEAEVDLIDEISQLEGADADQALEVLMAKFPTDVTTSQLARRLAVAIEHGDGVSAAEAAHKLCMDLAGLPVLRQIAVGPAPWQGQVAS